MSSRTRLTCGFAILMGIVLVAIPSITGMFVKAAAVDDLTDHLRPVFSDAALQQADADMTAVEQLAGGLGGDVIPALAQQFDTTPDKFAASLAADFPDVGAGMQQLGTSLPYFRSIVDGLRAEQHDFRLADAIPTKNLPAIVVPFLFLVPGLVLIGLGSAGLLRRRPIGVVPVALAIGTVLVVAPLLLSVPAKAQAVDDLTDAFRPVFSAEGTATTRGYLDGVHAMVDELTGSALPGLATQLDMDPSEFGAMLTDQFPNVAAGLGSIEAILGRFDGLVGAVESNTTEFHRADSIPTSGTPTTLLHWLFVVPGIVLLFGACALLVATRVTYRRRTQPVPGVV